MAVGSGDDNGPQGRTLLKSALDKAPRPGKMIHQTTAFCSQDFSLDTKSHTCIKKLINYHLKCNNQ